MAKKETKKQPHPLLIAWAAGVFDRGISWPSQGYVLKFDTVDEQLVRKFHDVVGIGQVVSRGIRNGCKNEVMRWQTTNADQTRDILLMLSPFLSPRQTTYASKMIAKVERYSKWQKDFPEKAAEVIAARRKDG